jgi:L-cysteine S-thiosulfotransferase
MRSLILAFALIGCLPAAAQDTRRSGAAFMSPETRAMQADDGANPAMLSVLEGEALWSVAPPGGGQSCAGCHGDARASMAGAAAGHPAFDAATNQAITLEGRIRACRTERQKAPAFAWESRELLALAAFIARQSRSQPIAPSDPRIAPTIAEGRRLYSQRLGRLNLACQHCHDDNAGQRLGSAPIPEAHPTAYPIYRLEWQSVGSLQRRLRGCLTGVRAEPFAYGAPEMIALEAYLRDRAVGMILESPGVRP